MQAGKRSSRGPSGSFLLMPAALWESDPAGDSGESESESDTWDMELAVPAGLQGASGAWSCSELMFNIWELGWIGAKSDDKSGTPPKS